MHIVPQLVSEGKIACNSTGQHFSFDLHKLVIKEKLSNCLWLLIALRVDENMNDKEKITDGKQHPYRLCVFL